MADASSGSSEGSGHSGKCHSNRTRRVTVKDTNHTQRSSGQTSDVWDGWSNVTKGDISDLCSGVEDKEIVKKSVAIVIRSTQSRQGLVSLCTKVAELFQKIQRLELTVIALRKELASTKCSSGHPSRLHKATQVRVQNRPVVHRATSPILKQIRVAPYSHSTSVQTEIAGINEYLLTKRPSTTALRTVSPLENSHRIVKNEAEVILPEIHGTADAFHQEKDTYSRSVVLPSMKHKELMKQELGLPKVSLAKNQTQTLDCSLNGTSSAKYRSGKRSPPATAPQRVHRKKSACGVQCSCAHHMDKDSTSVGMDSQHLIGDSSQQQRADLSPSVGDYVACGQLLGVIKFIGPIDQSQAVYVGLHLDSPVGHHNGTIHGEHFFSCPQNYGAFVPSNDVIIITSALQPVRSRRDSPSGR